MVGGSTYIPKLKKNGSRNDATSSYQLQHPLPFEISEEKYPQEYEPRPNFILFLFFSNFLTKFKMLLKNKKNNDWYWEGMGEIFFGMRRSGLGLVGWCTVVSVEMVRK